MFFITYHPDGAVKSVLSRMEGGKHFSYKTNYAKVTTSMGKVKEYWFLDNGETAKVKLNGATIRTEEYYDGGRTTIDELGNRVIKTYDANNNLLTKEYADGSRVSYTYDSHNNQLSKTNELGVETRYTYNDMGLPTVIRRAYQTIDEQRTELEYDADGNLVKTIQFNGADQVVTTYSYDANGNMVKEVNPVGGITTGTYDYMGNLLAVTDPIGVTIFSSYDLQGNLVQQTHANGRTIETEYDAANRPVKKIDSAGGATIFAYDYQDNLNKVTDALGGIVRFNFDKDNRLTKRIDQEGKYQIYFYEHGTDKISKILDGNNNAIEMTYRGFQGCGTCLKTYKDKPVQIKFPTFTRLLEYNLRGRLIKQTDKAEGVRQVTSFQYDKAGHRIAVTNAEGYTSRYEYDKLGRKVATIDPVGGVTTSNYDALGNLIAVTDAKGQTTTFTYNKIGQKIREIRPLGNTFTFRYDQAGRLLQAIDAKGQLKTYQYDATGHLHGYTLQKSADSQPEKTVILDFNQQGQLTGYNDGATKGIYTYDILGRELHGQVDYGTFLAQHAYTYYKNGLKKSYTAPDGETHYYQYNSINRLTEVSIPGVAKISYEHFNWLLPEKLIFPGIEQTNSYDGLLRLVERRSVARGKIVLDLNYTYDALNQVNTKQIANTVTQYGYDDLQRLIQVEENGQKTELFKYDGVHNRIADRQHIDLSYNANNQLLRSSEIQYQYDANGNTLRSSSPNETVEYIYDLENRLVQIIKNDVYADYVYDPFGRRVAKKVNGEQTWFYYAAEGLVAEFTASGELQTEYGYTPNSIWTTNPVILKTSGEIFFFHNDHLGTPNIITDTSGTAVWVTVYNAFGKATVQTGQIENNLRFPGHYYDSETDKHYNWHRFYDPSIGRYISADPIGLNGGVNLYAYVEENPINWFDCEGLRNWKHHIDEVLEKGQSKTYYPSHWITNETINLFAPYPYKEYWDESDLPYLTEQYAKQLQALEGWSYCGGLSTKISCAADAAGVGAIAATAFSGGVATPATGIVASVAKLVSISNGVATFILCEFQPSQITSTAGTFVKGWWGAAVSVLDSALSIAGY
ncbi:RHS repeat-associated core domain-containing protein [Desulfogranum japonicum]|uniref:RHS repeat-associated core domain-containing protein n=1 Tax=Desulfogranum japonicum TaxID=231447 RepID=UPI001378134D|nr:RHS repeat-associated core domain-containing protein [Desulfogranum japonicum]